MKAYLFDLDGTLIDSADDIALALQETLKELGMPEKMPENVRRLIGGGVKALLEQVLGEDFREEYVRVFRKYYVGNPVVYTRPYPGIPETLQALKKRGVPLVVVTNKLEELSLRILEKLELLDFFELVVGGDTFSEKKPSPLPILKALEFIGIEPGEALMIGDTEADIESGRKAGTKTALAKWGYVRLNSLKPDYLLNRPEELLSLASQGSDV
ncbi:phosphoglycolate phosphatase [Hydrogenivirga caldilitoris]|uniref:phosphoglycolate phosphatase n=1 Tax=Hydrogenivirga caldilitoris TaxID=246264 RepID=A0A497XQW8_9AQUI|nr:HAD-IA family hydrolase [Hydrogenivirga caldilitoris]RLJ71387.1 phosphoglycolate phosphatase [Hydrogenivirga caldilitoris]